MAQKSVPTDRLDASLSKLLASYEQNLDRDRNAVFFSISGRSLRWRALAHYLYYGSGFINIVLGASCGAKAKALHRQRTKPVLVCYEFTGSSLSKIVDEAALEDILERGNIPELEHLFLSLWLFWRRKGSLEQWYPPIDFTHIHRGALPNGGIPAIIEIVDEGQIEAPDCRLGV